jgi:outer membrane protein TolC
MQELRYRSGATTILDLLDSQVDLAEAEAVLIEARYVNRLALARLEAILGRRLFTNKDAP